MRGTDVLYPQIVDIPVNVSNPLDFLGNASTSGVLPHMTKSRQRREELRKQATERQAAWAALSPKAQLKALDGRLGAGKGAKKQRVRIAAALKSTPPQG